MRKKVHRLHVSPEGTIYGVYSDKLACLLKDTLGVFVKRISDVTFNHKTRKWDVVLWNGKVIASDPLRERAIEKEVSYLNSHKQVIDAFRKRFSPLARNKSARGNRAPRKARRAP